MTPQQRIVVIAMFATPFVLMIAGGAAYILWVRVSAAARAGGGAAGAWSSGGGDWGLGVGGWVVGRSSCAWGQSVAPERRGAVGGREGGRQGGREGGREGGRDAGPGGGAGRAPWWRRGGGWAAPQRAVGQRGRAPCPVRRAVCEPEAPTRLTDCSVQNAPALPLSASQ